MVFFENIHLYLGRIVPPHFLFVTLYITFNTTDANNGFTCSKNIHI